ncbi:MAG: aminotransferase class IV [Chloroflexota bacterium]
MTHSQAFAIVGFVSAIIAILTPHGLKEAPYTVDSLADAGCKEPEGVYEITRTYPGQRVLLLDAHLDRLENSARLENIPCQLDREAVRGAIRRLLQQAGFQIARLRLTVAGIQPDQVIIALESYDDIVRQLKDLRVRGVITSTRVVQRRNPAAKTNDWVRQREAVRAGLPDEVYEVIIMDPANRLLEGFSSNFYAIMRGKLFTAEKNMLPGIARQVLLQVATQVLPVELNPVYLSQVSALDEAFLTSSGRGVVPIVRIDDQVIGDGRPGPYTRSLMSQFDAWVGKNLEFL